MADADHFLFQTGSLTGAMAGAAAINNAVVAECFFAWWHGRKAIRECILTDPADTGSASDSEKVTPSQLFHIAVPLVLTELLTTFLPFLGSGAMSRMPQPVDSLAVYPAVYYVMEFVICIGMPLNEVSLAVLPRKNMNEALRAFVKYTVAAAGSVYFLFIITPLRDLVFTKVFSFSGEMAALSYATVPLTFLFPLLYAVRGYYSAVLMEKKNTRPVFEALLIYQLIMLIGMGIGIFTQRWIGVKVIFVGMSIGSVIQTIWMWYRSSRIPESAALEPVTE